ncbi:MAG: hypothetical protein WA418_10895 [Bradyrhizobium sp.]
MILWTFGLAAVVAVSYIYSLRLNNPPIRSDGLGYYVYLPAFLIDHDPTFKTTVERLFRGLSPNFAGLSIYPETGHYLDKFPLGTALLQLPFFLAADGLTMLLGLDRSGVSPTYQVANVASGFFYFLAGLFVLLGTLQKFFEDRIVALTAALIVFGTNVFHYATYDGSFSHVYTFALASFYVALLLRYAQSPGIGLAAASGAVLGLIVITRNVNAILGLLAFGIWLQAARKSAFRISSWREAAVFGACLIGAVAPLLVYWKFATGHFLVYSYGVEAFNWAQPNIVNFLFSVRKGLVFWTPAILVAVAGFLFLPRALRAFGAWAALCIAGHLYVCASWEAWSFGGSFGSRPFVDVMPILAFPFAAALAEIARRWNAAVVRRMVIGLIVVNCILMNAYWVGIIPYDETTLQHILNLPANYYAVLTRRFI